MNKIIIGLMGLVFSLAASEIYATFSVKATKSASLAFDAGGIIKKVNFDIASSIKKGDLLAVLKNGDKKANLDNAITALKYAKKDYDRQVKVKKLIDASKFDAYSFKYENAKNNVAFQKSMYDKTFLRAPFNGVVFFKDIEVGDTVSGMSLKTVYKVQSQKSRKLVLEFDQKYYKTVKLGDMFTYQIDGDTKKYVGSISKIYPSANASNRKLQAEVKVNSLMVGLFGDGYITSKNQ